MCTDDATAIEGAEDTICANWVSDRRGGQCVRLFQVREPACWLPGKKHKQEKIWLLFWELVGIVWGFTDSEWEETLPQFLVGKGSVL